MDSLQIKEETLRYGARPIIRDINMEIKRGENVALLGESGSGKSTLLAKLRALQPTQVAWCPQDAGLVPVLSVFHNIYAGTLEQHVFWYNLRNLIRPYQHEIKKVEEIAAQLGIADVLRVSVDKLSGGQRQRVNIARAMIQKRPIFLGDEPVSALDEYQSPEIIRLLVAQHSTCVFALHDIDLALLHCQRIIAIAQGEIFIDANVDDVDPEQLSSIYRSHRDTPNSRAQA